MSKRLYPTIKAGMEISMNWRKHDFKMACCDCGLVHRFRFTVRGLNLIMQGWRDNRATGQLRRHLKPTTNTHRASRGIVNEL